MKVTVGQKLTVFSISNSMAHTIKQEITVASSLVCEMGILDGRHERQRLGTYKPRGKRKFYLDIQNHSLVFEGWDLPIISDFEVRRECGTTSFNGNACLNLGAPTIGVLKDYIDNKNLNDTFTEYERILFVAEGSPAIDDGVIVYPDKVTGHHAVIERILEKQNV